MPHISILPPDQASKESKAVYDEFHRRMQFPAPPNFIMTQGHSSYVARGTWELVKNVLVGGEIERWKKEMIFVAISRERNCRYCLAAHIACCRMPWGGCGVGCERAGSDRSDFPRHAPVRDEMCA
jgi:alkylhydroperoxidase family enzyme